MISDFKATFIKNLGYINLTGKVFGRALFLLLTSFFAAKLSVEHFAKFAIFWTSLRMITFFVTNNLYIIYFSKARENLIEHKKWDVVISNNIIFTVLLFLPIVGFISWFIFTDIFTVITLLIALLANVIIRNLSEFGKADNNLVYSILIEDVVLYTSMFCVGLFSLNFIKNFNAVLITVAISSIFTSVLAIIFFKRKFGVSINNYQLKLKNFSFSDFKVGISFTILRSSEVISNFASRYLGQFYFGDTFVAYTHIMYQFYNVFTLLTMSVVSGFQSKITKFSFQSLNKHIFNKAYLKILKTTGPFVVIGLVTIIFFSEYFLQLFFQKYVQFSSLLVMVGLIGLLFAIIQPAVFIFIYNNQFKKIKNLNILQYLTMMVIFVAPLLFNINEEIWLLLIMGLFIIIQGFYTFLNYLKL